jgi:PAS domain S-box-containing protein
MQSSVARSRGCLSKDVPQTSTSAPVALNFKTNFFIAAATLVAGWLAIANLHGDDAALHTVLDTSVALTGALIALLLWDVSRRLDDRWSIFLAISFGLLAVGELVHVLAVLGWLGGGAGADVQSRAGTWGPPAHLLPIGVGAALLFRHRNRSSAWLFGSAMVLLALVLIAVFLSVSRYTPPGLFGITRPSLILVPILWAGVGIAYWRRRQEAELAEVIALTAVILACAHIIMLYSRAPSDPTAMAAHFGKFVGEALLLFSLIQIGAADTGRRRQVEKELTALNRDLDERVAERTAQLRETEERASSIIDAALDAVITIDDSGAITGWNPLAEKTFGWTREEALGRAIDETIMPDRYRQAHRAGLARYLATGEARVLNKRVELVALHRNGKEFPVELAITPLQGGDTISFSAFIRDITEHKAREEQIRQLQRMDAIGRLTGGVAHDFNNLLAIIHGNSELLRTRIESGSDEAEMADDVIGASARGAELVKRLLAFARMQHLDSSSIDLNVQLENILALLQRSLGETVAVQVKPGKGLWPAMVDPTQVDDAIVNLAINARDAMPGGGKLTIETRNVVLDNDYAANHIDVVPGEYIMLAVSDTGIGMSPDVIERAFEPFFTTKQEGQGTGLGLSQVFGWVKQSGGHIKIYSEAGHGTTIKLYLPRSENRGVDLDTQPEIAAPRGDETIFVVEDNPNVRKTVIRQLDDLGYRTVEADSGARALQLVKEGLRFDLLLTDVIMPGGITGFQLAEQLRVDHPELKVLFTSGYTEVATADGQLAMKDPLLSKPYRKQDLGRAVRSVLDQSRAAQPA